MPNEPEISRHFLTWEWPLLPQAVAWLTAEWAGGGPLDLAETVVLVRTRQAGRRLREALAMAAAERGQAVFSPRVLTPETFTDAAADDAVATRAEAIAAWAGVFRAMDPGAFRAVFPRDPPERSFAWALRLAGDFQRLQSVLAEGALTLEDAAAIAAEAGAESERWSELARLGRRQAQALAARGRREPQAARLAGELAGSFRRIVVVGVPDLSPLARRRLGRAAERGRVDVLVYAPAAEADAFDRWGRPLPEIWSERVLALPDFERRVRLEADPAAQAATVAALVGRYGETAGRLAVGVADPEIAPLLEAELTRQGRPPFNPEGRRLSHERLGGLLGRLAAWRSGADFGAVEALARCPDVLAWLAARAPRPFAVERWLDGLDDLRARHLPADLRRARQWARQKEPWEVEFGLERLEDLRARLNRGGFGAGVTEVLREIESAAAPGGAAEEVRRRDAAVEWMAIVRECAGLETGPGGLAAGEAWELALQQLAERRIGTERPAGALELQGWLELMWEDAPHLVVAGCNDGSVPEAAPESPFLPESLRARCGLETDAARRARDAYLLQALAASRPAGRLDLLLGKTNAAGDPLRPSRLLLQCPDAELPERVFRLFAAVPPAEAATAWRRTWKLRPRPVPPPERVAVTALRAYLECPFRFYLRFGLKMEAVEPGKCELDAFDFGTLCHAALERIGREPALRDATDPAELRTGLLQTLDAEVVRRYGRDLALPLVVQVESARQRLGRLAELQAAERAAGWVVVAVERPFEVAIAGLTVRGKIDRIDRHAATGAVRVIDYKTSDTAATPAAAHHRKKRTGEEVPEWAEFAGDDGQRRVWTDLQLPLYLRALAEEFPERPRAGYFNLPKAAGEAALALWDEYSPDLHAAAMRCAEGACAAIRAGRFWPPAEDADPRRDAWAALFHRGTAESVEAGGP